MVDIIEGYETEEQQVDAIKSWWKENGNTLIIGAVVGLAGLWGWRFYNESIVTAQETASQAYSDVLVKFEAQGAEDGLDEMKAFIADNSGNNYGVLASLLLAKEAVVQKQFDLAKTQLVTLQSQNSYVPLNAVINLRLARVEAELGEYEQALKTLELITEESFLAKAGQVKGGIHLQQGDLEKARSAFKDAVNASKGRVDPVLQLQLDDLAVSAPAVPAAPVLDAE
ncbi:YfgM family protein [Psychromonas ossibalaenae]|uniref:YfgM family protein n=1 Tax=Psychromonas ossibalaenae TaxID=444922 RepID=UPI00035EB33E|nr:tetratricopeptide repeat protein [Psychromonas ossibalaenae]